jgi:hypothetical protein
MTALPELRAEVRLLRKLEDLPLYVVIPDALITPWALQATTTVEGTIDQVPLGRRSLPRLDDDHWFLELRAAHLAALGKGRGDRAQVLAQALRSGRLWAELALTAADGMPVCASVRPPAIRWTADSQVEKSRAQQGG